MTIRDKEQIRRMRDAGMTVHQIAGALELSVNTVKSYCRRNRLERGAENPKSFSISTASKTACKHCGKPLPMLLGRKPRQFCSDTCRYAHWYRYGRSKKQEQACPACGKAFFAPGNRERKYCSHACYIAARRQEWRKCL